MSVVIDLLSRRIVGWFMLRRMITELALQALLTAVWHKKPKNTCDLCVRSGARFLFLFTASELFFSRCLV